MKKWQLYPLLSGRIVGIIGPFPGTIPDVTKIWTEKDKKTGNSTWDTLAKMASERWELVSATPITQNGFTIQILYTLKRQVEDGSQV
jgi:hypothetical protein